MNPIKALVLSLFGIYWVLVVLILVFARDVFGQVGRLSGDQQPTEIAYVLVLTALLALLSTDRYTHEGEPISAEPRPHA
jgi:hypothetical protein